jgi:response regulator of citrate/malate metabolism
MSAARPILIVEDDDAVRQMLVEHVAASGEFQSVEASTLGEATRYLRQDAPARSQNADHHAHWRGE